MKQIIIIFLVLLSLSAFSQKSTNKLNGKWLAVKTDPYNTTSHYILDGYLLEFNDKSLRLGHIFYDSLRTYSYFIHDSSLVLQDSSIIKIYEISNDSIKLIFDNESLVTFIKLPFTKPHLFKIDTLALIDNSWIYSDSNYIQRIEFLNKEWEYHDDDAFECYTHPILDTLFYDRFSNKWRIFDFGGSTYFARTFGQHYGVLHEIIDLTMDTIITKAWIGNSFRTAILTKIKSVPKSEIINIQSILTSKIWNVEDVKYKDNNSRSWKQEIAIDRINQASFEKKMKFSFTNDSLKIYNNDSTLINSRWDLTNDGKYIVIIYNDYISYVEIVDLNKRIVNLKNSFDFSLIMGLLNFNEVEIEITLE